MKTETEARLQMDELKETQERILAELEQKLAEVRISQPDTCVVFRCHCSHLEQVIAGVGELLEVEVPVVPRYEEIKPIIAVGEKGRAPGHLYRPWGVAIDENANQIYVPEGLDSCRISTFSITGEFINTFKQQEMREPYGIAIHRDNLYLTDRELHVVFKFKIETDLRFVCKKGSEGSGIGQFNNPYGLAVSTKGDVLVADCINNQIQILDYSLHFQRFITHQTMQYPCDVKLTQDEVCVLCSISPCILVFSHAGEKIRSLITSGTGMQIDGAYFFCLDRKQNLLLSVYNTNKVKIFSKEGRHLHTIGQQKDRIGMFSFPQGIVITKNLKLVIVSRNTNNQLQILYPCHCQ